MDKEIHVKVVINVVLDWISSYYTEPRIFGLSWIYVVCLGVVLGDYFLGCTFPNMP